MGNVNNNISHHISFSLLDYGMFCVMNLFEIETPLLCILVAEITLFRLKSVNYNSWYNIILALYSHALLTRKGHINIHRDELNNGKILKHRNGK